MTERRTRLSVYGLARCDHQLLLVRVAPGDQAAGAWTLPGGGVEWGESPLDTLEREMYEETGLGVSNPVLLGVRSGVLQRTGSTWHVLQVVYRVDTHGAEPHPTEVGGSVDAAAWHGLPLSVRVVPLVAHTLGRWA